MDRFKKMASFVGVADKGSFAADAEGVTPVVIGRRIDALENRLGARLLHRSTRRLTLTERGGRQVNVRVSGNLDCNDGELLHRWAIEGLGIAWRSTWEIAPELERGELVTVLDPYALPSYDIHAVYPQHRHVPARLRLFVDYLKGTYSRPGYWSRVV